jgi:hypothetical protein
MTTADTDEDDNLEVPNGEQPDSNQEQSPEDSLDERLPEDAEPADDDKDGPDEVQDPLLLAQMDEKPKPKEEPPTGDATPKPKADAPKPKAKAEAPKPKADDNLKPEDDQQAAQADLKAAQEKIPAEDWQKVSHKTRSQILTMQRIARTSHAAVEKARAEAEVASKDYQEVDTFRKRHNLEPQEFMQAVSLGGAIKSGHKDAIPFLEATLEALRKHHGIEAAKPEPEVKVETFGIDPDELSKLADAAENFDLEAIAKLKALAVKAKEAKGKVATPPAPKQPAPTQQPADRQQQHTPEQSEFAAIHESLSALGVSAEDMERHTVQLIKDITGGDAAKLPPPGQRLRAIVAAHHKRIQAAPAKPPVKTKPNVPTPPMSGRTGPSRQVVVTDPSTPVDPLKIAFKR